MAWQQPIELRSCEFKLLEVLMRNRGRLMTRTMLLERYGLPLRSQIFDRGDPCQQCDLTVFAAAGI
jgi:hypothetical protein